MKPPGLSLDLSDRFFWFTSLPLPTGAHSFPPHFPPSSHSCPHPSISRWRWGRGWGFSIFTRLSPCQTWPHSLSTSLWIHTGCLFCPLSSRSKALEIFQSGVSWRNKSQGNGLRGCWPLGFDWKVKGDTHSGLEPFCLRLPWVAVAFAKILNPILHISGSAVASSQRTKYTLNS